MEQRPNYNKEVDDLTSINDFFKSAEAYLDSDASSDETSIHTKQNQSKEDGIH